MLNLKIEWLDENGETVGLSTGKMWTAITQTEVPPAARMVKITVTEDTLTPA